MPAAPHRNWHETCVMPNCIHPTPQIHTNTQPCEHMCGRKTISTWLDTDSCRATQTFVQTIRRPRETTKLKKTFSNSCCKVETRKKTNGLKCLFTGWLQPTPLYSNSMKDTNILTPRCRANGRPLLLHVTHRDQWEISYSIRGDHGTDLPLWEKNWDYIDYVNHKYDINLQAEITNDHGTWKHHKEQ